MIFNKDNFKKLFLFLALIIGIYLLFSIGTVAYSLYSGLMVSPNLKAQIWNNKSKDNNKYVIGIMSPFRGGEFNQAVMVKQAAEKLGHSVYVYVFNDLDMELFTPAKYINGLLLKVIDFIYKTDFHLAMSFHVNIHVSDPKIMYISVPEDYLIERKKLEIYPDVYKYSNFLDINLLNQTTGIMNDILKRPVNSAYGLVGIPANDFHDSERQRLVMFGSLWGRNADNFYQAINKLATQNYMYFIKHPQLLLGVNHPQQFTKPAPNLDALQKTLNEYGIALCTHSRFHVQAGIPSSRIFEIISSGAIAISDKNPFVVKYFGDNVLYFDSQATSEEIFSQIDQHVRWVQTHKAEAEQKARNAHKILQDNFTTEKFVQDMIDFYKKIDK